MPDSIKKILVIGDSCRDIFVYCSANRLCPDIPVPVLNVVKKTENDGMAMNLKRNLDSLLYTTNDIITNKNWKNVTKTRYMHLDSNHMFIRIDDGHEEIDRIDVFSIDFKKYDLIAISDYNKGFLTEQDISYICNAHDNVLIDTKKIIGPYLNNVKYIKINTPEYNASKNFITENLENKIIRTSGGEGCYFKSENYPVRKVEVIDVSGAGDTFFAGLLAKFAETEDIIKSIDFANYCASTVVQRRGVSII